MAKYASKIVEQARAWIGCSETNGTHKQIIDVYNSHKPLARGYAVKYTDDWCATFVSAVAIKMGYTGIIPTECGCGKMIELFQKIGAWNESDSRTPNAGDYIFYDWQDSGSGDNKNSPDHVGIVEKVSGNTITVIEGNYQNGVNRREIAINGKYIRGYGVPKYDVENVNVTNNRIDTVREVQTWLNNSYGFGVAVDNIYGNQTKKALVKALQKELGFTGNYIDGIYGSVTNSRVKNNVLKSGSKGSLVKILQALLVCNGYANAYVDGAFGSGTDSAVRNYQQKYGLYVDGIAGANTFSKLCK